MKWYRLLIEFFIWVIISGSIWELIYNSFIKGTKMYLSAIILEFMFFWFGAFVWVDVLNRRPHILKLLKREGKEK